VRRAQLEHDQLQELQRDVLRFGDDARAYRTFAAFAGKVQEGLDRVFRTVAEHGSDPG